MRHVRKQAGRECKRKAERECKRRTRECKRRTREESMYVDILAVAYLVGCD